MKTISKEAKATMHVISRQFFNGANYSETLFYEYDAEVPANRSATGKVYEVAKKLDKSGNPIKGLTIEIGEFCVNAEGRIEVFPGLPQDFIQQVNEEKDSDKEETDKAFKGLVKNNPKKPSRPKKEIV